MNMVIMWNNQTAMAIGHGRLTWFEQVPINANRVIRGDLAGRYLLGRVHLGRTVGARPRLLRVIRVWIVGDVDGVRYLHGLRAVLRHREHVEGLARLVGDNRAGGNLRPGGLLRRGRWGSLVGTSRNHLFPLGVVYSRLGVGTRRTDFVATQCFRMTIRMNHHDRRVV